MAHEALLRDLALWRRLGWLRLLDEQFARFLARLVQRMAPESEPLVLLAGALASHQLGRGHICLPLTAWLDDPEAFLESSPDADDADSAAEPDRALLERTGRARMAEYLAGIDAAGLGRILAASTLVDTRVGSAPLVLDRDHLYLRRTWQAESGIAAAVLERSRALAADVDADGLGRLIREVFDRESRDDADEPAAIDWQMVACALAVRSRLCIITGGPGTGKTWTVVRIIALLQRLQADRADEPLRIRLAAPTGKAAQRLTESVAVGWQALRARFDESGLAAPEAATTIHRLLGSQRHTRHFRHDRARPLAADVVIVDEASMIDQELMQALLDALAPATRLILLGDKDQLASVEAGAVFGDLCRGVERVGFGPDTAAWIERAVGYRLPEGDYATLADQRVLLRRNYRSEQQINALAECVNAGDADAARALLCESAGSELDWPAIAGEDDGALTKLLLHGDVDGTTRAGYVHYLDVVEAQRPSSADPVPDEIDAWARACLEALGRFQVLTAVRHGPWGVEGINRRLRQWLGRRRDAGAAWNESSEWFAGRPVMITQNDYASGLMNGDVGVCLGLPGDGEPALRVVFAGAGGELRYFSPGRIRDCQTAWAMTVHKAQGSEFDHAVLVLPDRVSPLITRELIYTGLTRARRRLTLVATEPEVFRRGVRQRTERHSQLAERLG